MDLEKEKSRFLMDDVAQKLREKVGTEPWLVVHDFRSPLLEGKGETFFCGLIPESQVAKVLKHAGWDLMYGDGRPGCVMSGDKVWYERIGSTEGIEPLVIAREFHGCAKDYLEISEDFRLFHNLFHNMANNTYQMFDRNGDPDDVIRIENRAVKVKMKPLKQYLAIREMRLAVFIEARRCSKLTLDELGLRNDSEKFEGNDLYFEVHTGPMTWGDREDKSFARLIGKKLIKGMPKEQCGVWPYNDKKQYNEFVISTDEDGEPVTHTCDPDQLANYFGANPGAPHHLTPVYFRREVLTKYYNAPERFTIEDGGLRCGSLWQLNIDNDQSGNVMVYLGDLGRDLSHQEQLYWRHYNIVPDGTQKISATALRRGFFAEWANPQMADLVFKARLSQFQELWYNAFSWHLFKPLSAEDMHNLTALRVPVSEEQSEFDGQVLALAKILADSLNVEEMNKVLPVLADPEAAKREASIAKFERYLPLNGVSGFEPHIDFLRRLYQLRSRSSGHRKGSDFAKTQAKFGLDTKTPPEVFEGFLKEAVNLFEFLEGAFNLKPAEAT